ncbi:hypothetical protein IAU60_005753 [Kwoniella sp. DSM 27419]
MGAATADPPKKPGFFRRLSLSASHPQAKVAATSSQPKRGLASTVQSNTHAADSRTEGVAGPPYDSLQPTSATNLYPSRDLAMKHKSTGGHIPSDPHENGKRRLQTGIVVPTHQSTEPKAPSGGGATSSAHIRNRIHPALASPPNSPPQHATAASPYDSARPDRMPTSHSRDGLPVARPLGSLNGTQVRLAPGIVHHTSQPLSPAADSKPVQQVPRSYGASRSPRPSHSPLAKASSNISGSTARSVSQPNPARYSRFDDADLFSPPLPAGAQPPTIASNPQAAQRPHVSARRSTSSSRRTPLAKVQVDAMPGQNIRKSESSSGLKADPSGLSEASAYARAMAKTMTNGAAQVLVRQASAPAVPRTPSRSNVSRPLPTPPQAKRAGSSAATMVIIASSPERVKQSPSSRVSPPTDGLTSPLREGNPILASPAPQQLSPQQDLVETISFEFPRSPTLPPLVDPRNARKDDLGPAAAWSTDLSSTTPVASPSPSSARLPLHLSSGQSRRVVSSPVPSTSTTSGRSLPKQTSVIDRRHPTRYLRGKSRATLPYILTQHRVQHALLPHLNINTFLSLIGASDIIRKRFAGETVGRWVMKEWGIQIENEKGRTWPNLTVWEGFLESLLHDPASYSTYPQQWHSLLQHLSLSHSLIVLHLRQLPATAFANPPAPPFEDEAPPILPGSTSVHSFGSHQHRSRMSSMAGSDAGSMAPLTRMPRQERLMEIVMPEPLATQPPKGDLSLLPQVSKSRRRGSVGSLASVTSLSFGRRRSASINQQTKLETGPVPAAAPMAIGKAALPPVSYPTAKRYTFNRHGDPQRSRASSESARPGSIFSVQSSPSMSLQLGRAGSVHVGRGEFSVDRNAPPVPVLPTGLSMPPPIGGGHRTSFASSEAGKSSRKSNDGGYSPVHLSRRDLTTPPVRVEAAFDRPIPYTPGRAPILRVFVPLSGSVPHWPSPAGIHAAIKELEKCGALRRMRLGDLVVNTAVRQPKTTEHVLMYVPTTAQLLLPLEYAFSDKGHLPIHVNAFDMPPSYHYPFLPIPQVLYLDLTPFGQQALLSMRLAYDRRDVTVASGARLSAKRYLHVAGFAVESSARVAPGWHGMITLEAEATAEGKEDLEQRLVGPPGSRPVMGAWELVREKSMMGNIWLRLVK